MRPSTLFASGDCNRVRVRIRLTVFDDRAGPPAAARTLHDRIDGPGLLRTVIPGDRRGPQAAATDPRCQRGAPGARSSLADPGFPAAALANARRGGGAFYIEAVCAQICPDPAVTHVRLGALQVRVLMAPVPQQAWPMPPQAVHNPAAPGAPPAPPAPVQFAPFWQEPVGQQAMPMAPQFALQNLIEPVTSQPLALQVLPVQQG
jgi:hypothetical protein